MNIKNVVFFIFLLGTGKSSLFAMSSETPYNQQSSRLNLAVPVGAIALGGIAIGHSLTNFFCTAHSREEQVLMATQATIGVGLISAGAHMINQSFKDEREIANLNQQILLKEKSKPRKARVC